MKYIGYSKIIQIISGFCDKSFFLVRLLKSLFIEIILTLINTTEAVASKRATCSLTNPKAQIWSPHRGAEAEGRGLRGKVGSQPSAPAAGLRLSVSLQPRLCSLLLLLVNSLPLPLSWAHLWCHGGSTWIVQEKPRISRSLISLHLWRHFGKEKIW